MAGQQHALERCRVGLRLDRDAGLGRDRLRGRVGLLARQSSLLDPVVGDVAGGVHVGNAVDAPVLVDRQEPARIDGSPATAGPSTPGA